MESTNSRFGMSLPKGERRSRMVACSWKNSELMRTHYMLRVKPNAIFLVCTGVALAYCSCAADRQDKEAYRSWGSGSTVSAR